MISRHLVLLVTTAAAGSVISAVPSACLADLEPAPVLSLIVSGADRAHLNRQLDKLESIHRNRKVRIGNVYILGHKQDFANEAEHAAIKIKDFAHAVKETGKAVLGENFRALEEAGVPYSEQKVRSGTLGDLDIQYSPTWVVRYRGKDYIFEGWASPNSLFSSEGKFLGNQSP